MSYLTLGTEGDEILLELPEMGRPSRSDGQPLEVVTAAASVQLGERHDENGVPIQIPISDHHFRCRNHRVAVMLAGMTVSPPRRRGQVFSRAVAALIALAFLTLAGSASGEPDSRYPNMAAFGLDFVGYDSTTLNYVAPSKQWVRIPNVKLAVSSYIVNLGAGSTNPACERRFGVAACTPPSDSNSRFIVDGRAFPVANLPADPRQARFDTFPEVKVRMAAFGAIPVEATLSLTLPTDKEGFPVGIKATTIFDIYQDGGTPPPWVTEADWNHYQDTPASGEVWVNIKALRVDGVPVAVGTQCRTATPATLDLLGKGFAQNGVISTVPPGGFSVTQGGTLTGTINIPQFSGCGVGGEDLSPLVSTMASGNDFPVEIKTGQIDTHCWSRAPSDIDWSQCPDGPELPIPTAAP